MPRVQNVYYLTFYPTAEQERRAAGDDLNIQIYFFLTKQKPRSVCAQYNNTLGRICERAYCYTYMYTCTKRKIVYIRRVWCIYIT